MRTEPVPGADELILVRHGESIGNVAAAAAHLAGAEVLEIGLRDADVPLSETGAVQARALGLALAQLPPAQLPTRLWTSPYVRAHQTAQIALESAGLTLPVTVDERLRDRELGILDLLTTAGVEARFPYEAARRRWLGKFYHRPPGGESWADLVLRVRSVLRDLDEAEAGERVLVVCHDALVMAFRYVCERLTEAQILDVAARTAVKNVSITRLLRLPDRRWQLTAFNDVSHLQELDAPVTHHPGERDVHPR